MSPAPAPVVEQPKVEKPKREKVKADPALIRKSRELRDRYLEQFNAGMVLASAKYEVSKQLPIDNCQFSIAKSSDVKLLEQAA